MTPIGKMCVWSQLIQSSFASPDRCRLGSRETISSDISGRTGLWRIDIKAIPRGSEFMTSENNLIGGPTIDSQRHKRGIMRVMASGNSLMSNRGRVRKTHKHATSGSGTA